MPNKHATADNCMYPSSVVISIQMPAESTKVTCQNKNIKATNTWSDLILISKTITAFLAELTHRSMLHIHLSVVDIDIKFHDHYFKNEQYAYYT